jgi:hypothetical protein
MRSLNSLNDFRRYLRPSRQRQRPEKSRRRLCIEELEGRIVLSNLFIDASGNATLTGSTSPTGDSITLSDQTVAGVETRTFTDALESITVTGPGSVNCGGSGTHTVTCVGGGSISSISLIPGGLNDVVDVKGTDVPTSFTPSTLDTLKVDVQTLTIGGFSNLNIRKPVAVNRLTLGSALNVNVDDSADSFTHHWTLSNNTISTEFGTLITYFQPKFTTVNVTLTGSNVSPTGSANDFNVTNTPGLGLFVGGSMTINTGSATNAVTVKATSGPLTIQGHGGNDAVDIGGAAQTVANILGSVTIGDTGATTTLGVDDFNDTTPHSGVSLSDTALTGLAPAPIFYQTSGLAPTQSLQVTTGQAPDTITVTNTPHFAVLGVSNSSGTEQVNVQGVTGELLVQAAGSFKGALTAVVGSPVAGGGDTLANINGLVDFTEYSNTNLIVDDSGDTTSRNVKMDDLGPGLSTDNGVLTGLSQNATVAYSPSDLFDNSTVTVKAGSGGNVFNIADTTLFHSLTTIDGGKGGDTFNVATTQGGLTINAGAGSNHVNIQGTAIDSVANTNDSLNVVGHGGNDVVTVGSPAPALGGTLANLFGPVIVSNTTSSTALVVDDSKDSAPRKVVIQPNFVSFVGIGQPIEFLSGFSGLKSADVFGGTSDTFVMANVLTPATQLTLHGGPGTNALMSGSLFNGWTITGTNAGTLQNTIAFENIQNLVGSPVANSQDDFVFDDQAGVTGSIRGGSGSKSVATLDYSKYTTTVTVDLKLQLATGVGSAAGLPGRVLNVQDVTGGKGTNIIVGDGNNNVLQGGSGRSILISGGGLSTLQGGSGEAVLVGGHYVLDTDLNALDHFMAEWSRTDLGTPKDPTGYLARVAHLLAGGGKNDPFLLNNTTVIPDPGTQTLSTGAGLDFVLFDSSDFVPHPPKVVNGVKEIFLPV